MPCALFFAVVNYILRLNLLLEREMAADVVLGNSIEI
jgi:hypothetical protein